MRFDVLFWLEVPLKLDLEELPEILLFSGFNVGGGISWMCLTLSSSLSKTSALTTTMVYGPIVSVLKVLLAF